MMSSSNRTHLATLHDNQSPSGFGADKTIAVVHDCVYCYIDCVYCYIFRNTRVSRTCAEPSEKPGAFRHTRSIKFNGRSLERKSHRLRKNQKYVRPIIKKGRSP